MISITNLGIIMLILHLISRFQMYWLQFSDFYDWPHIILFDDFENDLPKKLEQVNLKDISEKMMAENQVRKRVLLETWCEIIKKVP